MILLIIVILTLITVSFLCSVLESVILSVSQPYIQVLIDSKKKSGKILFLLKKKIQESISAILILNTVSNTAGAAFSGAIALNILGTTWMAVFSAILTFIILMFAEILPKTIGVLYWKKLAPLSGYIIYGMIFLLKPVILPIQLIFKKVFKGKQLNPVSKAEILNLIRQGHFQGVLDPPEYRIMENLFGLQTIKVKEILTPRSVVYWLHPEKKVRSIMKTIVDIRFSRIPLYDPHNNKVVGIVMRREIMNTIARSKMNVKLHSLASEPEYVMESMSVYKLLNILILKKNHIAVVINEYGDYTGIVTLEDAIETLLGREIIDEFDTVVDMKELARRKGMIKNK